MSDLDFVKQKCATYEQFIEKKYAASGRGLHEKVSSVENLLPTGIVKKLRFIATIRNKMFHEADYEFHDDKDDFKKVCAEVEKDFNISPKLKKESQQSAKRFKLDKNQKLKLKFFFHLYFFIIFLLGGVLVCSSSSDWGIDDKINNKFQDILNLEDQIKYEKSKIESVKKKYSKIRFWETKSREDIIEIEKYKTRIKVLDAEKSEAEKELSELKGQISSSSFKPIQHSPLFVPWFIILISYFCYVLIQRKKSQFNMN